MKRKPARTLENNRWPARNFVRKARHALVKEKHKPVRMFEFPIPMATTR
jgi:hypothetical protein